MSTIKQIRAFVAIADCKSFAEACGVLHLSQPALSIAIKNLEHSLGGPLLARSTRTLALTPEGQAFLPNARRLLHDWDSAIDDARQTFALKRGKISLAAMPSLACNLLPKALVQYHRQYPEIAISVQDVVAEQVINLVRSGRVEIGVSFEPSDSEGLTFMPLFADHFIAVVPPKSQLSGASVLHWSALLRFDFIALQRPASMRTLFEQQLARHGMTLTTVYESHQLATIGRMVADGLGVSAVPALCRKQMEEMGAYCCPLEAPQLSRHIGILTRRRYPLSQAAQALYDVLQACWQHDR